VEAAQMPINGRRDKQNEVYSYNEILFAKQERTPAHATI
jgi:hypothetical protein